MIVDNTLSKDYKKQGTINFTRIKSSNNMAPIETKK